MRETTDLASAGSDLGGGRACRQTRPMPDLAPRVRTARGSIASDGDDDQRGPASQNRMARDVRLVSNSLIRFFECQRCDMAKGLRCVIGMHAWVKSVSEGEASLTCSRCGAVSDGPGGYTNLGPGVN